MSYRTVIDYPSYPEKYEDVYKSFMKDLRSKIADECREAIYKEIDESTFNFKCQLNAQDTGRFTRMHAENILKAIRGW